MTTGPQRAGRQAVVSHPLLQRAEVVVPGTTISTLPSPRASASSAWKVAVDTPVPRAPGATYIRFASPSRRATRKSTMSSAVGAGPGSESGVS